MAQIFRTDNPLFGTILKMRGTWAFALSYAMTAPVFWFYLYWLPPFLNQQYNLGISVTQMGIPLIRPLTLRAAGAPWVALKPTCCRFAAKLSF